MSKPKATAASTPHSWPLKNWPASVYPNSVEPARHLVRSNRDSLRQAGALARVGRTIVILGDGYSRWLSQQSVRVTGFKIAPNAQSGAAEQITAD